MIPESLHMREAAAAKRGAAVAGRRAAPHGRCGLCDLPIAEGAAAAYVDDERCHLGCAEAGEPVYGGSGDEEDSAVRAGDAEDADEVEES